MTLSEIVAQNLRAARVKRGFSQEALARTAGLSLSYVFLLESGRRKPPLDTLEKIAAALDVQPWKLLFPRRLRRNRTV